MVDRVMVRVRFRFSWFVGKLSTPLCVETTISGPVNYSKPQYRLIRESDSKLISSQMAERKPLTEI